MIREWEWYSRIVYMENNKVKSLVCKTESEHLEFMLELTFSSSNEKIYKLHWFYGDSTPHNILWA